ncbi:MAG: hypothetical protein ACKVOU_07810, partial [Cytophagales bacterium]
MKTTITKFTIVALLACQSFLSFGQVPTITGFGKVTTLVGFTKVAFGDCDAYGLNGSNLITISGDNFIGVTTVANLKLNNNIITSFTVLGATLIQFTIPDISNTKFSGQISIDYTDNLSNFGTTTSLELLTVVGCPSSIPSVGVIGGSLVINGYDLSDVHLFRISGPTFTSSGSVFYNQFTNQSFIPISNQFVQADLVLIEYFQKGVPLSAFEFVDVFLTQDINQITIDNISPLTVTGGGTITLAGFNLNSFVSSVVIGESIVPVNGYTPDFNNISATYTLPYLYSTQPLVGPLIINNSAISSEFLTVLPNALPSITGFSVNEAYPTEEIRIDGVNLEEFGNSWKLKFPTTELENFVNTGFVNNGILLVVEVPGNGTISNSGNISIVGYNTNELISESATPFTIKVYDFTILGLSSPSGKAGDVITVFGQNFVPSMLFYLDNDIEFFAPTYISSSAFAITVPPNVPNGPNSVIAFSSNGQYTTDFQGAFSIDAPFITSVSPQSVPMGGSVTVFGNNFDLIGQPLPPFFLSEQFFGRASNPAYTVVSDTEIRIDNIGDIFAVGDVITINLNNTAYGELQDVITVLDPPLATITSINPLAAEPYQLVTVIGENLNFITSIEISNTTLSRNDVPFEFQNASTIVFVVPYVNVSDAPIVFSNSIYSVTSLDNFTVLGPPPAEVASISTTTGYPKDKITLTGQNLDGIQSVEFNGEQLNFTMMSNGNFLTITPPSFFDNSVSSIVSNFIITKDQGVITTVNQAFTLLLPPPVEITNFTPTSQSPGKYVTLSGSNLRYIENVSIFNGEEFSFEWDENSFAISGDFILKVKSNNNSYNTIQTVTGGFRYSPFKAKGIVQSITSQNFNILPYPLPTVTGILTPAKIYPNSEVTIIGSNFDAIDEAFFPALTAPGCNLTPVRKSEANDTLIFMLQSNCIENNTMKTGAIRLFASPVGQFDQNYSISTPEFTVEPFDGQITILDLNKLSFNSSERIVLTINSTGTFSSKKQLIELSDANGTFAPKNNIVIGELELNQAGNFTISSDILAEVPSEAFLTGTQYKLRIAYFYDNIQGGDPSGYSNTISDISFARIPVFALGNYPFEPYSGVAGEPVKLRGNHFYNSSIITAVTFNDIPANFVIPPYDRNNSGLDYIFTTLPGGNIFGKVKILYTGGETLSLYDFGTPPPCNSEDEYFRGTTLSGTKMYESLDNLVLSIDKYLGEDLPSTIAGFVQLSDFTGSFGFPFTIGSDNFAGNGVTNVPIVIPPALLPSNNYAMRILYVGREQCIVSVADNITINGISASPSITGIALNGNSFLRNDTITGIISTSMPFPIVNDFVVSLQNSVLGINVDIQTIVGFLMMPPVFTY